LFFDINMWTKDFRFCLFSLIYDDSLGYREMNEVVDYEEFVNSVLTEYKSFKKENVDTGVLRVEFESYLSKKNSMIVRLTTLLPDWNKTFEIIKAVLLCFLIEKQSLKIFEKDKLVVSYIKFAEGYCVSSNVKLIHAVLSKLVDEK
jgi:transcription termination factor NusB